MSKEKVRVDLPLKKFPLLVAKLNISDFEFCSVITELADKLWIHLRLNSAEISESEFPDPQTLFVTSVKNAKITDLNRSGKVLNLSQPLSFTYEDRIISFNEVDLTNLTKFNDHMEQQIGRVNQHFNWSENEISDTGRSRVEAWKMMFY